MINSSLCDQKHNMAEGVDGPECYRVHPDQLNTHQHCQNVSEQLEQTDLALIAKVHKRL